MKIEDLIARQQVEDPVFTAWVESVPDKHWVKLDLSALRVGYELGRATAYQQYRGEGFTGLEEG